MIYNNRTPYILKYKGDPSLVENELFIDSDSGIMYIFKYDGNHISVSYDRIYESIKRKISKYVGSLTSDDIKKLIGFSNDLYQWMLDSDTGVTTPDANIYNIFKVFNGFDVNDTLKNTLDKMVDKVDGKTLVSNSFTLDHILKINSVAKNANFYSHPSSIQCNLGNKVESIIVDGESRTGNVKITKYDIGYGGVESGANKYEHPKKQVCQAGVISINGAKGYADLTKKDFNILKLPNVPPASYEDYDTISDESMFLSSTSIEYLDNRLAESIKRSKGAIPSKHIVVLTTDDVTEIRNVSIGGVTNSEFIDGKMAFNVYDSSVIISVLNRRGEYVLKRINISGNTEYRVHFTKLGDIVVL